MEIKNILTEEEILVKIILAMEWGVECLQSFERELSNIRVNAPFTDDLKDFYELKTLIVAFINDIEKMLVVPMGGCFICNPSSKYQFIMYELCSHFEVLNYRELLTIIEQSDETIEQKYLKLQELAWLVANNARTSLVIAIMRVDEIS